MTYKHVDSFEWSGIVVYLHFFHCLSSMKNYKCGYLFVCTYVTLTAVAIILPLF